MKFKVISLVHILVTVHLSLNQEINDLKLSAIENILRIVQKLDAKTEAMDAKLSTLADQQLLSKQQIEANQVDVLPKSEGGQCGSSHIDLLIKTFTDIFEGEQRIQGELSNIICTKDQVETLQDLLATDECFENKHNCSSMATCVDANIGFKCTCQEGYSGDGFDCQDVNECLSNTNNCSILASCTNYEGGFKCSCLPGFAGDGIQCQDIDECQLGTSNCSRYAQCHNTEGSFECTCRLGFSGDGFNCTSNCPSNFTYEKNIGCMHVATFKGPQAEAKKYCSKLHDNGRLIVPEDFESLKAFLLKSSEHTRTEYWVGVENKKWLSGDPVLAEQTHLGLTSSSHPLKCAYVHKNQGYKLRGNSCNHSFIPPICGLSS